MDNGESKRMTYNLSPLLNSHIEKNHVNMIFKGMLKSFFKKRNAAE